MRRGRLATAVVVFGLLGLVFAGSAAACTCGKLEPSEALAGSDAAVVGRLLSVEPTGVTFQGVEEGRFEYRVLHVYRGAKKFRPGGTLSLRSWLSGPTCGLPQGVGRHYGLLLGWGGERWRASLCSLIAPPDLRAAARDLEMAGTSATAAPGNCAG